MHFVWFIVLVGILVFVHELGHFIWAKVFGVRVLKFSLGFGPRIAGFTRGETEYVVAAVPMGGYVRMLGDNPLDEVREADVDRSFGAQSLWRRFVIIVAGPAMNLLFPVVLYFVVFLGDDALTPSTIGTVFPNRPADGQLEAGDRVTAIDGDAIETFHELTRVIESSPGQSLRLTVDRDGEPFEAILTPVASRRSHPLDRDEVVGRIGIMPHHPAAVVGVVSPTTAAANAGLKTFDVAIAAGGDVVERWLDLDRVFARNRGTMVPISYLRPVAVHNALGGLIELDVFEPRVSTLAPESGEGDGLLRAGIELAELYVSDVNVGSPEQRLGLLPGDRLLDLDGRPIRMWATFLEDLRQGRGRHHVLRWRRGDREYTRGFSLAHESGVTEHGQIYDRFVVGIRNWVPKRPDPPIPNPNPVSYAATQAWGATAEVVELTILSVVRLLQGRLSVKSIGGPLTILEYAGSAAREGAANYLTLMAFISINLGLINLLPIPMLDGGHLAFVLFEAVSRRRPSLRLRELAHIAGLVVLVAIMILAFKNDLERQWPQIIDQISAE